MGRRNKPTTPLIKGHHAKSPRLEEAYHYPAPTTTRKESLLLEEEENDKTPVLSANDGASLLPELPLPPRPHPADRRCVSLSALEDVRVIDEAGEATGAVSSCAAADSASDGESSTDGSDRIRRVSFTKLEIRSYKVILGDHPYCSQGCSVSLGWDYDQSESMDVVEYDEARQSQRRSFAQLRMTAQERHSLLLEGKAATALDLRRAGRKLHRARSCDARIGGRMNDVFFNGAGNEE